MESAVNDERSPEGEETSNEDSPAAVMTSVIHQVGIPRDWRRRQFVPMVGLVIGTSISFVVVVVILGVVSPTNNGFATAASFTLYILIAIYIGVLSAPIYLARSRARRLAQQLAGETQLDSMPIMLAQLDSQQPVLTYGTLLFEYAHAAARQGMIGWAALFRFTGEDVDIEPITDSFEPRLLNESDSGFHDLLISLEAKDAKNTPNVSNTSRDDEPPIARLIRRAYRLRGSMFILLMSLFLFSSSVVESVRSGRPTFGFFFWGLSIGLDLIMFRAFILGGWHLVPGGVFVLLPKLRWIKKPDRYYTRATSNLVIVQMSPSRFWAGVADGTTSTAAHLTAVEVQMLLSGWISPAPSPTDEQVASLVTGTGAKGGAIL